jgi:hypothetical protein
MIPGTGLRVHPNVALKSNTEGSKIQIVDMLKQEVKMTFKMVSIVGVGSGMLYCDAEKVLDTVIDEV